ncbi:MAG: RpiB/LacA/LacB family sugar-phosphate isomerase [Planctomycetes bacterium]|nr:RpiB/LacA/LacB family sugar-phosphate isomerase [Planctomycetota bacterium]
MDGELIDRIVRQVLEALGNQAGGPKSAAAPVAQPHPAVPAASDISKSASGKKSSEDSGPSRKIFITAQMLQERLAGGTHGGLVELEHNEYLTPNAQDLADDRSLTVRKQPEAPPAPSAPQENPPPAAAQPAHPKNSRGGSSSTMLVGLVLDRPDQKVSTAVDNLRHDGLVIESFNRTDCVICNTLGLCEEIAADKTGAGVVIAPYAADLVMLANKVAGVRAVQGSRPDSVAAAVRRFGANLLIVEHAFATFHEIRTMIALFAKRRRTAPTGAALMQAVEKLERRPA